MSQQIQKVYEALGKKVASARKSKNISQEELATRSGIDRSHIGFIEQGRRRPTVGTLYKLAKALDIKLEDLFKGLC